jgi:hypothetical protein
MGILGDDEDDVEEKVKRNQARQAGLSGDLEEKIAARNYEEDQEGRADLLDPKEAKMKLKQLLLNLQEVEREVYVVICSNCGQDYQGKPENWSCTSCDNEGKNNFRVEKHGTQRVLVEPEGQDSLINSQGFNKVVWPEDESIVNKAMAGGYMENEEISKLVYSSLSTVTQQLALYPWRYGVDNATDMQQIGDTLRPLMMAQSSKARGGRGLRSQEKTTVEKITHAISGGEDDEDDGIVF